jgi:hypothetical protein
VGAQWSGLDPGNWQDRESLQEYVFSNRAEALYQNSQTLTHPASAPKGKASELPEEFKMDGGA